jgi:hypothetical protein
VLRAARPFPSGRNRRVAYISAASLEGHYLALNHQRRDGIGVIHHLAVDTVSVTQADKDLQRAALLDVPA